MTAPARPSVGYATVWSGVRRHSVLTFLFAVLGAAAAALVWLFLPLPKMTATSSFQIAANPAYVVNPVWDQKAEFNLFKANQQSVVKTRKVLTAALAKPGVANTDLVRAAGADPHLWLSDAMKVEFSGPEIMRLAIEGNSEADLKAVLTAVTDAYREEVVNADKGRRTDLFDKLRKLQGEYDDTLRKERDGMSRLLTQLGSGDPVTQAYMEKFLEERIAATNGELTSLDAELRRTQVQFGYYDKLAAGGPPADVPAEVLAEWVKGNPDYIKLTSERDGLKAALDSVSGFAVPGGAMDRTKRAGLEKKLAEVEAALKRLPDQIKAAAADQIRTLAAATSRAQVDAYREKLQILAQQREKVKAEVDTLLKKQGDKNQVRIELEQMKVRMALTEKMADQITGKLEALKPELDSPTRVTLFEEPAVKPGIEGNRRMRYAGIAGLAVFALGLGVVTLLEHRNRRIVDPSEVGPLFGLKVVGTVPRVPHGAAGNSTEEEHWQQILSEAVDTTRAVLMPAERGGRTRTLLISSALSGEGKTSLATRLAVSLARAGYRTLLIDADMRRPAVHRLFDLSVTPGLSDVLAGRVSFTAAVQIEAGGLRGLDILPSGGWCPEAAAGLSGAAWANIRTAAEAGHEIILVDSPPILPVADALLLAGRVDGVILSIMRDVSRYEAVEQARGRLAAVGANVLGVVVTGVSANGQYHYYDRRYVSPLPPADGNSEGKA